MSGCLFWEPECLDPATPAMTTPLVMGMFLDVDPEQPWDTVLLVNESSARGNWSITPTISPEGWTVSQVPLGLGESTGNFSIIRVAAGTGEADLSVRAWAETELEGYCSSGRGDWLSWDLMEPVSGETASAGQGVHVLTAGFFENGTLFYTNIKEIDQDLAWPRPDWYAWEGGDPLPVYVYDQDRAEEPAIWSATTAGTPAGAPTQNLTLWDYYTTIPGFNNALKGLSTKTVSVVHISPEDAYTRPGNEEHPLYGDSLVFLIKIVKVVDLPCPPTLSLSSCQVPGPLVNG